MNNFVDYVSHEAVHEPHSNYNTTQESCAVYKLINDRFKSSCDEFVQRVYICHKVMFK